MPDPKKIGVGADALVKSLDDHFFEFIGMANAGEDDFEISRDDVKERKIFEDLAEKYKAQYGDVLFSDGRISFDEYCLFRDDADQSIKVHSADHAARVVLDAAKERVLTRHGLEYRNKELRELLKKYGIGGFKRIAKSLIKAGGEEFAMRALARGTHASAPVMSKSRGHFDAVADIVTSSTWAIDKLFEEGIPKVAPFIERDGRNLKGLVQLARADGDSAASLFIDALPALEPLMGSSHENFEACKEGLLRLLNSSKDMSILFGAIPALAPLMVRGINHFNAVVDRMIGFWNRHRFDSYSFFASFVPALAPLMTKSLHHMEVCFDGFERISDFSRRGPLEPASLTIGDAVAEAAPVMNTSIEHFSGIVGMAQDIGPSAEMFFERTVPSMAEFLLASDDHFEDAKKGFARMFDKMTGAEHRYGDLLFSAGIPAVAKIIGTSRERFRDFVELAEGLGDRAPDIFKEGFSAVADLANRDERNYRFFLKVARSPRLKNPGKSLAVIAAMTDALGYEFVFDDYLALGRRDEGDEFAIGRLREIETKFGGAEVMFFRDTLPAYAKMLKGGGGDRCHRDMNRMMELVAGKFMQDEYHVRQFAYHPMDYFNLLHVALPRLEPLLGRDIDQFGRMMEKLPGLRVPQVLSYDSIGVMAPLMSRSEDIFDRCMEKMRKLHAINNSITGALEYMTPLITGSYENFVTCTDKLEELAEALSDEAVYAMFEYTVRCAAPLIGDDMGSFLAVMDGLIELAKAYRGRSARLLFEKVIRQYGRIMFSSLDSFEKMKDGLLEFAGRLEGDSLEALLDMVLPKFAPDQTIVAKEDSLTYEMDAQSFDFVKDGLIEIADAAGPAGAAAMFSSIAFGWEVARRMSDSADRFNFLKGEVLKMAKMYKGSLLVRVFRENIFDLVSREFAKNGFSERVHLLTEIYLTINGGAGDADIAGAFSKSIEDAGLDRLRGYNHLNRERLLSRIFWENHELFLGKANQESAPSFEPERDRLEVGKDLWDAYAEREDFRASIRGDLINSLAGVSEVLAGSSPRLSISQKMAAAHLLVEDLKLSLKRLGEGDGSKRERYLNVATKVGLALFKTATADPRGLWIERRMAFGDEMEDPIERIGDFQAGLLAELLHPDIYKPLHALGLNGAAGFESLDYDMKALDKSFEHFRRSESPAVVKKFSNNLNRLLKDDELGFASKQQIFDFYFDFFENPERFRLFAGEGENSHLKGQIVTHFISGLLFAIREEEMFSEERREAILVKAIETAEGFKSSKTRMGAHLALGLSMNLHYLVVDGLPIALKYEDRIDRLYRTPKGPDKSLFADGEFVAKIYFQEREDQDLWEDMYINDKYGYAVESFQVSVPRQEDGYGRDDIIAAVQREANYLPIMYRSLKPLLEQFIEEGEADFEGRAATVDDIIAFLNARARDGYIQVSELPSGSDRMYGLMHILGLVSKTVYSRRWSEGGEARGEVIIAEAGPYDRSHFSGSVFEIDDTDPYDVDYRVFIGHAGGGTVLEDSFDEAGFTTKPVIIHIANCWSVMELYKVQENLPFAHPIVTEASMWSYDGAILFGYMMEGVKRHWDGLTYADVRAAIDASNENIHSGICYVDPDGSYSICGELDEGNRIFIDEDKFKLYSDIDGDGMADYTKGKDGDIALNDRQFNFVFGAEFENWNDLELNYTTEPDTPGASKVGDTIGNLDAVFENEPFLRHFSRASGVDQVARVFVNTGGGGWDRRLNIGEGKGWFWGDVEDEDPLDIRMDGYGNYTVALNIGYANQSKNALRILAYTQLARVLAREKPELNRRMIDRMFRWDDLIESDLAQKDEILRRAAVLGLKLEDLKGAWGHLVSKFGSEEGAAEYVSAVRGTVFALDFLRLYYEKSSRKLQLNPNDEKARTRLEETKELYANAVRKYNLPQIDFETAMKLLRISTSPFGWYIAYAAENDLVQSNRTK